MRGESGSSKTALRAKAARKEDQFYGAKK